MYMQYRVYFIGLLIAGTLFISCKKVESPDQGEGSKFRRDQLFAKFPADLGASTVDVSKYPPAIQQKYKLFLAVCSSCHTSARPLNSPYVKAYDWKRFVKRMHLKMEQKEIPLEEKNAKEIIEFLVYDSKIRKIDGKSEFESQKEKLRILFDEISKEREKFVLEETKQLPKKETPFVGVK